MLEVTGILNGQSVKNKIISATELMEALKVRLPANQDIIRFNLNTKSNTVITLNKADGKERYANSFLLTTYINGFYEGQNIQIRYYTSKIDRGGDRPPRYTPEKLTFQGKSQSLSVQTDLEKIVFMYLFPLCSDSPIRDPKYHEVVYSLYDVAKHTDEKWQREELFQEVRSLILNLPDVSAVNIARGIKIGKKKIPVDMQAGARSAKIAMLEMAKDHPGEMHRALTSMDVQVIGAVTEAIEKGFVKQDRKGNVLNWHYGDLLGGEKITSLKVGENPKQALIDHLMNREAWINFQQVIHSAVGVDSSSQKEEVTEVKAVDPDLADILQAIEERMVTIHPSEDKIYIMEASGHLQDRALLAVDNRETWKEELIDRSNKIILGRIRKRLNESVNV